MTQTDTPQADRKKRAIALWNAGTQEANGTFSVQKAIEKQKLSRPDAIVAIGKAASAMALGALEKYETEIPTLVVTKYDHTAPELAARPSVSIIEAAHPIPDENSLIAGRMALDFVTNLAADTRLMLLISGGASSLAEVLVSGTTLADLKSLNQDMISQDRTIEEINAARRKLSLIKSGGLLSHFKGAHVDVVFISDVMKDDPDVIGSGIGSLGTQSSPPYSINSIMAANNQLSRQAVADEISAQGLTLVENEESLYGEISELAKTLANRLRNGENGVYVWGGEPVVNLPENPGKGGRNQALALLLARELSGRDDIAIVVGGTDGTDGPTTAAGGIIDGRTYNRDKGHDAAIAQANAGEALAAADSLLVTGPTGTNVMDLVVAVKTP